MATFRHNKKRNVGLVYELLVRHMASRLVENDKSGYENAVRITKKYFAEGQPLAEERALFEAVKSSRGIHVTSARRIVAELQKYARALPVRRNDIKKSNLIKEINYAFANQGFWDHRVPEYRLLASIQMMIEHAASNLQISESVQKIELEEAVIKYMTTVDRPQVRRRDEEKVDDLVCSFAVQRFHERYGSSLNDAQRGLLEKYTRYSITEDKKTYVESLNEERSKLLTALKSASSLPELIDDSVMRERFDTAQKLLNEMDVSFNVDQSTQEIMLYHRLVEELKSNE